MNRRRLLSIAPPPPPFPRPPGAVEEARFRSLCDRCMDCAVACPHATIGLLDDGTPALNPNDRPCHMCPDQPCATACPTGALAPVPQEAVFFGLAAIQTDRCLPFSGPECGACRPACPLRAISMEGGLRPTVDLDRCNGCGLCREACVVFDKAIQIDLAP